MSAPQGLALRPKKDPSSDSDMTLGQVWVSNSHQPICIPANSAKVVNGKPKKKSPNVSHVWLSLGKVTI